MTMELHPPTHTHPPTPLRLLSSLVQTERRCVFVREYVGTSKPSKKTLYERQCVCVWECVPVCSASVRLPLITLAAAVCVCQLCCDCCGSSQEEGEGR